MRLASVLTPISDPNLRLASQLGVTDITLRYPGRSLDSLLEMQRHVESFGLRVSAVEGYLPIENIKLGNEDRDDEIEEVQLLIRNMAAAGIRILCYNFMAGTDWVRTTLASPERGGALVTGFDAKQAEAAISLRNATEKLTVDPISEDQLWANLEYFLDRVLPIAEENDVVLAMHPDDPPLAELMGRSRIMNCVENFERLVALRPSPSNAICFCQGTFAEMGVDIPATIRRLGNHIRYVHFRDVRGSADNFVETFHDNGPTDMFAAMCAYREIGFDGPMRPDHVPQLHGEEDGEPGYTMLGRLYAYGYMRALMQAAEATVGPGSPRIV